MVAFGELLCEAAGELNQLRVRRHLAVRVPAHVGQCRSGSGDVEACLAVARGKCKLHRALGAHLTIQHASKLGKIGQVTPICFAVLDVVDRVAKVEGKFVPL